MRDELYKVGGSGWREGLECSKEHESAQAAFLCMAVCILSKRAQQGKDGYSVAWHIDANSVAVLYFIRRLPHHAC